MGVQIFGEAKGFRYDLWLGRGPNTDSSVENKFQNG